MTDKERILFYIIQRFYPKYILGMEDRMALFNKCKNESIKVGDLVIAMGSGLHDFTVGYVKNIIDVSNMIIREIGSTRTCNISNESFYKIDTDKLDKNILLEGLQYEIHLKTRKALNKCSDGSFTGTNTYFLVEMEFNKKQVTVYLRRKWHEFDKPTAPKITFNYSKRTTLKEIIEEIKKIDNKEGGI